MERLSGLDASFLYLETPSLHMHVAMAMIFDPATVPGGYSFARIKGLIAERIPSAPVFRRRLVEVPFRLGHPVWVDDPDFDIDYHVRLTAVPQPGGPHELADLAGDITGRRSTAPSRCGRSGSSKAWPAGTSASSPRCTTRRSTASPVPSCSPSCSTSSPTRRRRRRTTGQPDYHVPSQLELVAQAMWPRTLRPFEMTKDLIRTGQRVLDVRKVRIGAESRPGRARRPSHSRPPAPRSTPR